MSRRYIVALVAVAILLVMVGALIYEAFDIHDPKPFPIDPEFLLMMCSGLLALCLGTMLAIRLLGFCLLFFELLSHGSLELTNGFWRRYQTFDVERILLSSPPDVVSLRI
ncbi:MAG TPA: hypothetical protein VM554_09085 [Acidisarcina sp.]|nr:hypothetical protein [Acidisarcina sp.]